MDSTETNTSEFVGHIDRAEIFFSETGEQMLLLLGWIVHIKNPITSITFRTKTGTQAKALKHSRTDIPQWLPHIPHASDGGFTAIIPMGQTQIVDGKIDLMVDSFLDSGEMVVCPLPVVIAKKATKLPATQPPQSNSPYATTSALDSLETLCLLELKTFLSTRERILFDPFDPPLISIIIVVYNQAHLTYKCIKSVLEQQNAGIEVILIDNASTDATSQLLSRIHGIRIIKNTDNVHFLEAANQAASYARGEYLLFLNNDTILLPGALSASAGIFRNETRVGAVGARLIRADGKLQEAGSQIFSDGSTEGRFVGSDPFSPDALKRADVDYCSGAFLLTPRELFFDLRMFDIAYKPAYYEDVDYCVRLQEYGYRIIYEPNVSLVHLHHGSASSSLEAQESIQKNRPLFAKRHTQYLSKKHQAINKGSVSQPAKLKKHILMIDDFIPESSRGQGQPRTLRIIETLNKLSVRMTMVALNEKVSAGIEPTTTQIPGIERAVKLQREKLKEFLEENRDQFTHLFVSRPTNMEVVQQIRNEAPLLFRNIKIIYDAEAVFAMRDIGRRQLVDNLQFTEEEIKKIVQIETSLAKSADVILTVSDGEFIRFTESGFHKIYKLSHIVTPHLTTPDFHARKGIISLGPMLQFDSPNIDGASWFVNDILPYLPPRISDAGVEFGGHVDTLFAASLMRPSVFCKGPIEDPTKFYDSAKIFIAPVRFGAGIPLKVIEAAAGGIPCVISGLAADQLGWRDGAECLVGRTARDFAQKITELYDSPELWARIQETALSRIQRDYNKFTFEETLKTILNTL